MSYLLDRYKEADFLKSKNNSRGRLFGIGITLLILVSVFLLCSCVALYIIKENEIEKRLLLEGKLENITKEKLKVSTELEEIRTAKTKIELELALKAREIKNYAEKFQLISAERGLLEEEKTTLVKKLASIQKSFIELGKDFEQLQQAKEILEQRLQKAIGTGIKLKTIIVEPEEVITENVEVKGEVLAVNKEYEFLVISLGLSDGITEDSSISIYRDAELVAVANVEKLYDNITAAVVNDRQKLRGIKVGDLVVATIEKPLE